MATKLSILKNDLNDALVEIGKKTKASAFLVDIAAGYGLAHYRLVNDIEKLPSAVERVGIDIDFTPRVDEAVKHLPVVSEKYYESLVRLGIVEPVTAAPEAAAKSGKVTADDDALDELMQRTNGRGTGAR